MTIDTIPDEVRPVSVPKDVTEGCEAVDNVPERVVAETEPALIVPATPKPPEIVNAPVPVVVLATVDVIDIAPAEVSPVSVPKDVIEGCEAVESVPERVVAETEPAFSAPATPKPPDIINAPVAVDVEAVVAVIATLPAEVSPVSVPKDVIEG